MIDLDAVERQLARDPLCSEANVPDLVAELRAAREVIKPVRDVVAVYSSLGWASWPQGLLVAAAALNTYDKVTGEASR